MKNKILNLLGLAMRARKVVLGTDFVIKQMQNDNTLIFLATDCGDNLRKKITDKAKTYNRVIISEFSSDELSKAIGKINRKVVLVEDKGFNKKFIEYLNS